MTDEQARKWRQDRLADLERIILRAKTPEDLARIEAATGLEFDDRLRRLIHTRMNAMKAEQALLSDSGGNGAY